MTIGELSKVTNISEYTLRYYEKKGLIRVSRDPIGRRYYEQGDIEWVKFIQRLKDTGMLLRDIEKYSKLRYEGAATMPERLEMLQEHSKRNGLNIWIIWIVRSSSIKTVFLISTLSVSSLFLSYLAKYISYLVHPKTYVPACEHRV